MMDRMCVVAAAVGHAALGQLIGSCILERLQPDGIREPSMRKHDGVEVRRVPGVQRIISDEMGNVLRQCFLPLTAVFGGYNPNEVRMSSRYLT